MQISKAQPAQPAKTFQSQAVLASTQSNQEPNPQVESFSSSFHPDVKSGLFFGALGFLPVVGALSNFGAGVEAGFNDNQTAASAAGIGALSNLGGTAALAGGLLLGNSTAINVGLGMLGVSGLTAAYAGFF